MKSKRIFIFTLALISLVVLGGCSEDDNPVDMKSFPEGSRGEIYLYGQGDDLNQILEKELELWGQYYHEEDMRHLFLELPYFSGEFLNFWMESEEDYILEELYEDWENAEIHNPQLKDFYKTIKKDYPETIFHGTDIGHQYYSSGQRFLKYLQDNGLQDSDKYSLALEAIEQGQYYYKDYNKQLYYDYGENKMVENFIREFDKLDDENIMGIYSLKHTRFNGIAWNTVSLPNMANQLRGRYGHRISSVDLSNYRKDKDIAPLREDTIKINGKDYRALFFGELDFTAVEGYVSREFWRLENAYDDFKDKKNTREILPYDNYPMVIGIEEVFFVDYTKTDGSLERVFYRSDGTEYKVRPTTQAFILQ